MTPTRSGRRTKRFNIRATPREDRLIRDVAKRQGVNVTDFILQSACTQAEQALADQQHFAVSPTVWKKFTDALDRPARVKPRLQRLLSEPSLLER